MTFRFEPPVDNINSQMYESKKASTPATNILSTPFYIAQRLYELWWEKIYIINQQLIDC